MLRRGERLEIDPSQHSRKKNETLGVPDVPNVENANHRSRQRSKPGLSKKKFIGRHCACVSWEDPEQSDESEVSTCFERDFSHESDVMLRVSDGVRFLSH